MCILEYWATIQHFRNAIKNECPSHIIKFEVDTVGNVTVVLCIYRKRGADFLAYSYVSKSWIGISPFITPGAIIGKRLEDIALVSMYDSETANISAASLARAGDEVLNTFRKGITRALESTLSEDGCTVDTEICTVPAPSVTFTFYSESSGLIGSCASDMRGNMDILMSTGDKRLSKYVDAIRLSILKSDNSRTARYMLF